MYLWWTSLQRKSEVVVVSVNAEVFVARKSEVVVVNVYGEVKFVASASPEGPFCCPPTFLEVK